MARHLIFGGYGMVGSAIYDELNSRNHQGITRAYSCYRIENAKQVWQSVEWTEPDFIWLCAGYTNVTKCETDPHAQTVNIDGVRNVAEAAQRAGAKLIFFSSSYVFDGMSFYPYEPLDVTNPKSMYGVLKTVGEQIAQLVDDYTIIRTCAVYGHDVGRKCFPYYILDHLNIGENVVAAADQIVCPIHSKELARLSVHASKQPSGIFHINGSETLTKYEWALGLAHATGLPTELISPISGDPIRPVNGTMRNSFYTQSYTKGMREFLNDYKAANS